MTLKNYINRVIYTNKDIYCDLIIEDNFDSKLLLLLCDLSINHGRLIEAWSIIIDAIDEKFHKNIVNIFIPDDVIRFLIYNDICLLDLGHLKLKDEYLKEIIEKTNSPEAKQIMINRMQNLL